MHCLEFSIGDNIKHGIVASSFTKPEPMQFFIHAACYRYDVMSLQQQNVDLVSAVHWIRPFQHIL
jgi:hypothetical protein